MQTISFEEFYETVKMGREIEFHLGNCQYFISHPQMGDCYSLWDESHQKMLFIGGLNDLVNFPAFETSSLKNEFFRVVIDYIL